MASLASPLTPATVVSSTAASTVDSAAGRDTCDLCNRDIPEGASLADHVTFYHATLVTYANELSAYRSTGKPDTKTLETIGSDAHQFARNADGGPEKLAFVKNAIAQLREVCRKEFPDATLFSFGSCLALGTYDGEGDIDLTLVNPKGWVEKTWPPKNEGQAIRDLARVMRDAGFSFDDLEPVVHTRVPVLRRKHSEVPYEARRRIDEPDARTLKLLGMGRLQPAEREQFRQQTNLDLRYMSWAADTLLVRMPTTVEAVRVKVELEAARLPRALRPTNILWLSKTLRPEMFLVDFDLSCRAHGIRNSLLIRAYMDQGPIIRAGSVFVKKWSKRCGLNNSVKGFLTSYAVQLLWIYFMIQHRFAQFVPTTAFPEMPEEATELKYTATVPPDMVDGHTFDRDLGSTIAQFFRFYAYGFDWENSVVSVSEESPITKKRVGWLQENEVKAFKFRDRVWYRACIEDPFEENLNLGRHLSPNKMMHVLTVFRHATRMIDEGRPLEILLDRTSSTCLHNVTQAAAEYMIGRPQAPVDELLAHVYNIDPAGLAAAQLEYPVTKLFHELGLEVSDDRRMVHYPRSRSCFVAENSRQLYSTVKTRVAELHAVGLRLTPEVESANLHKALLLFEEEHKRLFDSPASRDLFLKHVAVAGRVLEHEDRGLSRDVFEKRIEKRLEAAYMPEVVRAILEETNAFARNGAAVMRVDQRLNSAPSYVPERYANKNPVGSQPVPQQQLPRPRHEAVPAPNAVAAEPKIGRAMNQSAIGNCSGCRVKKGPVWPTDRPDLDEGWYCEACWRRY
jgi:hypothetical protein